MDSRAACTLLDLFVQSQGLAIPTSSHAVSSPGSHDYSEAPNEIQALKMIETDFFGNWLVWLLEAPVAHGLYRLDTLLICNNRGEAIRQDLILAIT